MKTIEKNTLLHTLAANKYVIVVILLALALLLLPEGRKAEETAQAGGDALEATGVPLSTEGERLETLLAQIEDVGRARVLLSKNGAVVVCDGAELATVRLDVTNAVMAYTGLGSDRISVMKMK